MNSSHLLVQRPNGGLSRWLPWTTDAGRALLVALLATGLALIVGLLIGSGLLLPAAAVAALFLAPLSYYFIVSNYGCRFDGLLWLFLGLMFLSSIISAITRQSLSFVSTAVLIAVAPLIIISALQLRASSGRLLIGLIIGFFSIGILSSVLGRSNLLAGIYSAVIATKPFLLVGFGCALIWSPKTETRFDQLVRWAWAPMLIAVAIQWFLPTVYSTLLADVEMVKEPHPWLPAYPRASGLFPQSSVLAAFSATFGLISLVTFLLKRKPHHFVSGLCYGILMFMSGQRQELVAAAVMIPLVTVMLYSRPSALKIALVSTGAITIALLALYFSAPEMMTQEMRNWGLTQAVSGKESARSTLYSDSFKIANQYLPLGSGFGTFGSIGSVRFDRSLYVDLGYHSFWWFTKKSYLMDAYWSRYIAETGWLGFAFHLSFYMVILGSVFGWIRHPSIRRQRDALRLSLIAFGGLIYVLLTSPTAFSLTEINGGLLPLMFVGLAWRTNVSVLNLEQRGL